MRWLLVLTLSGAGLAQDFDANLHKTEPNPENLVRVEAQTALVSRDYAKAIKLLMPLAARHPDDARLLYDLGSAQDALDQGSPAETSYKASIQDDPKLLEPRVALGLLEARDGRMAEARVDLLAVAAITDGDKELRARALRTLARIDEEQRPGDARSELLAALQLSGETPDDALLAAELAAHATGGSKAAEQAYRRVLDAKPNDPEASAALAHLWVGQERNVEAEALLKTSLAANPGDVVLTSQLAGLLMGENRAAEALPFVQTLAKQTDRRPEVSRLLAKLYAQTGDYQKAEPLYAGLLRQAPGDATLMVAEGDTLIHLNRFADAEILLAKAVAQPGGLPLASDLGDAAGRLAFAASENNDPAGALRALAIRATVLPSTATTLFLDAISEDKLHHFKAAVLAYRQFLAVANGTLPDQVFEAQHRLVALERMK